MTWQQTGNPLSSMLASTERAAVPVVVMRVNLSLPQS